MIREQNDIPCLSGEMQTRRRGLLITPSPFAFLTHIKNHQGGEALKERPLPPGRTETRKRDIDIEEPLHPRIAHRVVNTVEIV